MRATMQTVRPWVLGTAVLGMACRGAEPDSHEADAGGTTLDTATASDWPVVGHDLGTAREDTWHSPFQCSTHAQDCPAGQKCAPWANDGGAHNATKCVPIAEDPAGIDEPCHAVGSGTSGFDDCDLGLLCWDVDPETLAGTCFPMCVGSPSNPVCEDSRRYCALTGDGAFDLCVPFCNPLGNDCLAGEICVPIQRAWVCAPDASGDAGAYGDPCEYVNVCDPGLVCLNASALPPGLPCEGAAGCCTEVCDLTDPLGDLLCAGAAEDQTCQGWSEEGEALPGLEHVGACALPQ